MELGMKLKKLEGIFFTYRCKKQKINLSKISRVIEKKIEKNLKNLEEMMPDMVLSNEFNLKVNLYDFIGKRDSLIFFYRGAWCPYSNINLEHLMNHAHDLNDRGYNIIVISNSIPKEDTGLRERVSLPISILSDSKSQFVSELGLTYNLTEELSKIYKKVHITPDTGTTNKLIYPAIFLVDSDRIIKNISITEDEMYLKNIENLIIS